MAIHAPNHDVRTDSVQCECMYRYTPSVSHTSYKKPFPIPGCWIRARHGSALAPVLHVSQPDGGPQLTQGWETETADYRFSCSPSHAPSPSFQRSDPQPLLHSRGEKTMKKCPVSISQQRILLSFVVVIILMRWITEIQLAEPSSAAVGVPSGGGMFLW